MKTINLTIISGAFFFGLFTEQYFISIATVLIFGAFLYSNRTKQI